MLAPYIRCISRARDPRYLLRPFGKLTAPSLVEGLVRLARLRRTRDDRANGTTTHSASRLHLSPVRLSWCVKPFQPLAAWGAFALFTLAGCSTMSPPLRTVDHVDLDRYLGRWYVIANIPYFLENGKVASYDTYARRPDGRLDNIFTFRPGGFTAPEKSWHGTAWVTNPATNAEWKVRFVWPLTSTYLVLELDPDYRWAVVGTPGRGLLWILARERRLSSADYGHILDLIGRQGYDRTKIVPVPQPDA